MASQDLIPTLHHLTSSQSTRVLFALEELAEAHGLKYKIVNYERTTKGNPKELKDIHPLGKSPILTLEHANGEPAKEIYQLPQFPAVLAESQLILQFIRDTWSRGDWDPASEDDRLREAYFIQFALTSLSTQNNIMISHETLEWFMPWGLRHILQAFHKPLKDHFKKGYPNYFQLMEDSLSTEKPWFSGAKMGLADINMIWPMGNAWQRGYYDEEKFPKVTEWYQRITGRPAWKRALEKSGFYDLKKIFKDA